MNFENLIGNVFFYYIEGGRLSEEWDCFMCSRRWSDRGEDILIAADLPISQWSLNVSTNIRGWSSEVHIGEVKKKKKKLYIKNKNNAGHNSHSVTSAASVGRKGLFGALTIHKWSVLKVTGKAGYQKLLNWIDF